MIDVKQFNKKETILAVAKVKWGTFPCKVHSEKIPN